MIDHILSVLIFFPAIAAVFGFMIHKDSIRAYGVSVSAIEFALSLWLWFSFDNSVSGMQFMENVPLLPAFGVQYLQILEFVVEILLNQILPLLHHQYNYLPHHRS